MTTIVVSCVLVLLAFVCNAFMDSLWHSYVGNLGWRLAGRPEADKLDVNPSWWGHARHVWLRRYNTGPNGEPRSPQYGLRSYLKVPVLGSVLIMFHDAWHTFKAAQMLCFMLAVAVALPGVPWWAAFAVYPVVGLWWEGFYALFKREAFLKT